MNISFSLSPYMEETISTIRLHLWLEIDQGVYFGLGRALFLAK
jgi:hypothetical protein